MIELLRRKRADMPGFPENTDLVEIIGYLIENTDDIVCHKCKKLITETVTMIINEGDPVPTAPYCYDCDTVQDYEDIYEDVREFHKKLRRLARLRKIGERQ